MVRRAQREERQWLKFSAGVLMSSTTFGTSVQMLSDVPGGNVFPTAPRLLRLVGCVNWLFSSTFTFQPNTVPFLFVGMRPTNINEAASTFGLITPLGSDLGWYGRTIIPIPAVITAGNTVPVAGSGGHWRNDVTIDWPVHGGVGTGQLTHDRAVRFVMELNAQPLGASTMLVAFEGWQLIAV